jgi:hypothetical protein
MKIPDGIRVHTLSPVISIAVTVRTEEAKSEATPLAGHGPRSPP